MKFPTDNFGRAIKMLREIYVVDVKELADYSNISASTIYRLEKGRTRP